MCNAWNHPRNCTCGWGGEGHAGKKNSGSHSGYIWVPPIQARYESYVNPNASCPVCDAAVFFYQSPDGGRVFFDELGPPWPKHPCTDNKGIPKPLAQKIKSDSNAIQFQWQKNGWTPLFDVTVSGVDKHTLKVSGSYSGDSRSFYVNRVVNHLAKENPISTERIMYIKPAADGEYDLSILNALGVEIKAKAYDSILTARDRGQIRIEILVPRKGITKNKVRPEKPQAYISTASPNTAMAIAFNAAKKTPEGKQSSGDKTE